LNEEGKSSRCTPTTPWRGLGWVVTQLLNAWARATAEHHLRPMGRRWTHAAAVGGLAEEIAQVFGRDTETASRRGLLHDIGRARVSC
jgi:HD superfamily phosphodiesterase